METKVCTKCEETKPLSAFARDSRYCRTCKKAYDKAKRQENPERARAWRRNAAYKQKFGITLQEYEQMFLAQNGQCAICRKPQPQQLLSVDHDHSTGNVRALLCISCNTGIGQFKDDPTLVQAALAYLQLYL